MGQLLNFNTENENHIHVKVDILKLHSCSFTPDKPAPTQVKLFPTLTLLCTLGIEPLLLFQ